MGVRGKNARKKEKENPPANGPQQNQYKLVFHYFALLETCNHFFSKADHPFSMPDLLATA